MTKYQQKLASALETVNGIRPLFIQGLSDGLTLEDRARMRISQRDLARQCNIERIIGIASAELPDGLTDNPASRDWLNQFFDFAQNVSDDISQQIWGRLLALYIANPDAVFKRSLIALNGMDIWEVKAFIEYRSFAFSLDSGWNFVFEEGITRREMWGYVQGQDFTQHFINIGLLSPELVNLRPRSVHGMKIRYFDKEYELVPSDESEIKGEALEIGLGYRKFTPTGQQIAKAVKARAYNGYARNLVRTLDAQRNVQFRLLTKEDETYIAPLNPSLIPAT